jgi:hypothetical protein
LLVSRISSRMCASTLARQSQWRLALHVLYNRTLTSWSAIQGPGRSFVSRCLLGKWRAIFSSRVVFQQSAHCSVDCRCRPGGPARTTRCSSRRCHSQRRRCS